MIQSKSPMGGSAVEAENTVRAFAAGSFQGKTRTVVTALPIDQIEPNPAQPRRHFDPVTLAELAASIRKHGLLQPVIVCRGAGGRYLLMAGERRYRAARLAGLQVLPALVRDDDPIEVAMIENLQREDLSPLEEAEGLGSLIDQYGYTHEALAELIGKSRPYVSNTLALRRLPEAIKSEYHAAPQVSREILISVARAESPERQEMLWKLAKLRKLSVQRFRSAQAGEAEARGEVAEVGRLVRRLNRKLKALESAEVPGEERASLIRFLQRAQGQIARVLTRVERAAATAP